VESRKNGSCIVLVPKSSKKAPPPQMIRHFFAIFDSMRFPLCLIIRFLVVLLPQLLTNASANTSNNPK